MRWAKLTRWAMHICSYLKERMPVFFAFIQSIVGTILSEWQYNLYCARSILLMAKLYSGKRIRVYLRKHTNDIRLRSYRYLDLLYAYILQVLASALIVRRLRYKNQSLLSECVIIPSPNKQLQPSVSTDWVTGKGIETLELKGFWRGRGRGSVARWRSSFGGHLSLCERPNADGEAREGDPGECVCGVIGA